MSNYYLTNAAGLGHYDSATDRIVIDENIDGYKPITDAADVSLGGTAGAGDGQNFAFHVSYADPTTSAEWESNILTLEQGTPDELAYVSTVDSNTGSKMFNNFSATPSSLLIVGSVNHAAFNKVASLTPTFVTDAVLYETNNTTYGVMSDEVIITPQDATNGVLLINWVSTLRLERTTVSDDCFGFVEIQYKNAAGSWFTFGDSITIGTENYSPNTVLKYKTQAHFLETLSASNKNADGNWEIRISGQPSSTNTRFYSDKRKLSYQEI